MNTSKDQESNFTTAEVHPYLFATGIAYFICFVVGSILNLSVIIYLLVNFRKMIYERSSGILILSLTVCDFLFVILAFLYAIQHVTQDFMVFDIFSCQLPGYDIALMHVNIWTTLAVCVQRLAAIKWPFEYSQMFSRQRCILIMGGIWASSAVVGVPMGVFYEYKKVEVPVEEDPLAPSFACFIRGGDLQFLLTNITVYIIDFLVPAVLVTKYYWDFTVEVRRRSGGGGGGNNQTGGSGRGTGTGGRVSYSASIQIPNGIPPADSQPQTVPGNQSAAHPLANNPNDINPCLASSTTDRIEIQQSRSPNRLPTPSNVASTSSAQYMNFNNNQVSDNNNTNNSSNNNPGNILAHVFLQLYASVVSISCWVCFTPFYNMKFIQSVDAMTGLHVYHWIKPTGVGTYIDRTAIALTHLNSLINPMLFVGLKLYMKHSQEQRALGNANAVMMNQRKISAAARSKKLSNTRSNTERGYKGEAAVLEERDAISPLRSMDEISTSFYNNSEQTEA
ncbi:uncharacterized protein LOC134848622 [Symsagittifera roscoffensis]|uniref:uncharacterized protein LOC134848622 n=1 Tax=Symsagittifera roscoffensis TaxID=84072 RepID=UPI00307C336B